MRQWKRRKQFGKIQINVAIKPVAIAHVFDIMTKVFPHLFTGIRRMKKYGIIINTAEDAIEIQNIVFASKNTAAKSLD